MKKFDESVDPFVETRPRMYSARKEEGAEWNILKIYREVQGRKEDKAYSWSS